jgi:type I restriction enzyme S subunit
MSVSLPPAIGHAVRDYQQRLVRIFGSRLRMVRVFGSWSRGTAHEDSDIDVAVVVDGLTLDEWRSALALSAETEMHTGITLTALVLSGSRFDELLRRERHIAATILEEGIAA